MTNKQQQQQQQQQQAKKRDNFAQSALDPPSSEVDYSTDDDSSCTGSLMENISLSSLSTKHRNIYNQLSMSDSSFDKDLLPVIHNNNHKNNNNKNKNDEDEDDTLKIMLSPWKLKLLNYISRLENDANHIYHLVKESKDILPHYLYHQTKRTIFQSPSSSSSSISYLNPKKYCSIKYIFLYTLFSSCLLLWHHNNLSTSLSSSSSILSPNLNQFKKAQDQSFGYFTDIPFTNWMRFKERVRSTPHHSTFGATTNEEGYQIADKLRFINDPNAWYHYNWNPDFTCLHEMKVGASSSLGDGPKWVCDPTRIVPLARRRLDSRNKFLLSSSTISRQPPKNTNGCLIYSIGVNDQSLSFEVGIQKLLTEYAAQTTTTTTTGSLSNPDYDDESQNNEPFCEIHVFDPNQWDVQLPDFPDGVYYHPWGIKASARNDGTNKNNNMMKKNTHDDMVYFRTLADTVKLLGHEGKSIDILKVDCKLWYVPHTHTIHF